MALKTYRITQDDGTERYLQLSDDDAKTWRDLAEDKTSAIKSVVAAEPTPINAAAAKG